jgi:hypothetical protein
VNYKTILTASRQGIICARARLDDESDMN